MIAVRQARVPDIPRRVSFIRSVSTIVAFRVALKWLKSDSGASLRHSIPTMMLRTANVPRRRKSKCVTSDFHRLLCKLHGVAADLCNSSLSSHEIAADESLRFTRDHLVSGAHEEVRDEGKERGIETVDRRQACEEGKCHAWKEQKPFYNRHINHDNIFFFLKLDPRH